MSGDVKKILIVIGTRPEAIKMAPVIKVLKNYSDKIKVIVCSTGQHNQMLNPIFSLFKITPDIDMHIMKRNQSLSLLTSELFNKLDKVINYVQPDWIMAQGDTTSVFASSMIAFYHHIKFAHVEAGLRTGDKLMPFPEEINRRIADMLADVHFAPTQLAKLALLNEGINSEKIFVTGNTIVDSLLEITSHPYDWSSGPLSFIPKNKKLILVTAHRRESFGEPLKEICYAIKTLSQNFYKEYHFIFPVHLNPNVRKPVYKILGKISNVSLVNPLDYMSLLQVMKKSTIIFTDSGGIQEEAPAFNVPVLVMRNKTERMEGIKLGIAKLVGTSQKDIIENGYFFLSSQLQTKRRKKIKNPYGDGKAAIRISKIMLALLK